MLTVSTVHSAMLAISFASGSLALPAIAPRFTPASRGPSAPSGSRSVGAVGASSRPSASASGVSAPVPSSTSLHSGNTTANGNDTSSPVTFPSAAFMKNDIYFGLLPNVPSDDKTASGDQPGQKIADLNTALGRGGVAVQGWYAQTPPDKAPWDGSQLLDRMDDIKGCNCVFQASVMPTGGFAGYSTPDDQQAQAVAAVMKKFDDAGVPTILRWGHEMNFYLKDGTYTGDAEGFKTAWRSVAKAVKAAAPNVKMFWSPNVKDDTEYAQFWPDADGDHTVDYVGIDFYPSATEVKPGLFLKTMKDFHDKYAVDGRKFSIGETGLKEADPIEKRTEWLDDIMSEETHKQMPNFDSILWFNYYKGYDFRVAYAEGDTGGSTDALKSFFDGQAHVASGAVPSASGSAVPVVTGGFRASGVTGDVSTTPIAASSTTSAASRVGASGSSKKKTLS